MTHSELVSLAKVWLAKQMRCPVIITEMATAAMEIPDAIGWWSGVSILVECKTSRADFRADAGKQFRADGMGMGRNRYYLAEVGVIPIDELPPKWGLVELNGKRLKIARRSEVFECGPRAEIDLLISALRRIGQQCPAGVSIKCYTIQTLRSATIGLELEEEAVAP